MKVLGSGIQRFKVEKKGQIPLTPLNHHVKTCYTDLGVKIDARIGIMEKQNVTLSIPKALLKQAKLIAARQDKSLSQLLKESLEEKVREELDYGKARKRQLQHLRKGLDLGSMGKVKAARDDLHAR
jgi:uncharacterized radical SAM superfamily protein